MEIHCERYEDPDLKAMFDEGQDVSYAGETILFSEGNRAMLFELDDSMPGEALFSKIITNGEEQKVKLGEAYGSGAVQVPTNDKLLSQACQFLGNQRAVEKVAIYDGPSGFYKRVPIDALV